MQFTEEDLEKNGPMGDYLKPVLDDDDDSAENDSLLSYYEKQRSQQIQIDEKHEVQSEKAQSNSA